MTRWFASDFAQQDPPVFRPHLTGSLGRILGRSGFFLRKLRHPIPREGLVLDVGSGGDPHPRADVVVDRVIEGNAQRTIAFRNHGQVVLADIAALPFREKAFVYVLCSHVLEHVEDHALAAAELSRVGRKGYVETPSDVHEYMFPIGWHRWTVQADRHTLVFKAKESPFLNESLGAYFRSKWGRDKSFIWAHTDELFVQHHWTDRLDVKVEGKPAWHLADEPSIMGDAPRDSMLKRAAYLLLARFVYRRSPSKSPCSANTLQHGTIP